MLNTSSISKQLQGTPRSPSQKATNATLYQTHLKDIPSCSTPACLIAYSSTIHEVCPRRVRIERVMLPMMMRLLIGHFFRTHVSIARRSITTRIGAGLHRALVYSALRQVAETIEVAIAFVVIARRSWARRRRACLIATVAVWIEICGWRRG